MSQQGNDPYGSPGTEDAPVPPVGAPAPVSPYLSPARNAPAYGSPNAQYAGLNPQESWNPWAIASLVLGLCATAVLAVIAGHLALSQIKRTGERGTGLAVAGLILGYLMTLFYALVVVGSFGLLWWSTSQT